MLCSIGIQRSHLFSLSPQHPLLRPVTELGLKPPLIPREKSQPSRGTVWIMHFVSHKSHYNIFSGINWIMHFVSHKSHYNIFSGIHWIMHFVSHKSHYNIFSGIHRPKIQ